MKYKIIATDFDGTFLSSNKMISKENENTIKKCKELGCIIVGVTARNIASVKYVCDIKLLDYVVANNGACIYDVRNDKCEIINFLPRDFIETITKLFFDKSERMDYCSTQKYYSIKAKIANRRPFHMEINDISEVNEPVSRMNIYAKSNSDLIELLNYFEKNYPKLKTIVMKDTDYCEKGNWIAINAEGCNKAISLRKLVNSLGLDMADVVFFGDGMNDMEIIKQVGLGVAMGNAINEIKQVAADTTLSNDENGVSVYLERLFLKM